MTMPSSLRLKQPSSAQNPQETSSGFPSSLRIKKPIDDNQFLSDEGVEKDIERSQARTLSRIGETVLGAPGDIASFFRGVLGDAPLTGFSEVLPTSQQIREVGKKATGGYLEPRTEFEEKADELSSDIASMALPGGNKFGIMKNIGIPVVGNLVKEGLRYGTADEKSQAYGKMGTMVALDLLSRKKGGVKGYAGSLFQKAEEALPKGLSINASSLESAISKLEHTFSAGGSSPTTTRALKKITEIRNEIKNGKIDARRLAAYRRTINEAVEELGGFNLFSDVPQTLKPRAIRNLQEVKSAVIDSLEEYGKKQNPEYLKLSQDANEAWSAYSKSNRVASFLEKKVGYVPKSAAAKALFSYGASGGTVLSALANPVAAAGGALLIGGYQAVKVLDRVIRSPVLRKYYTNVLKEASAGNAAATAKNLKALDKGLSD